MLKRLLLISLIIVCFTDLLHAGRFSNSISFTVSNGEQIGCVNGYPLYKAKSQEQCISIVQRGIERDGFDIVQITIDGQRVSENYDVSDYVDNKIHHVRCNLDIYETKGYITTRIGTDDIYYYFCYDTPLCIDGIIYEITEYESNDKAATMIGWTQQIASKLEIPTKVTIDNIEYRTQVGRGAFANCKIIKEVKWPEQFITLPERVFAFCDLNKLTLPKSIEGLGNYVFTGGYIRDLIILTDSQIQIRNYISYGEQYNISISNIYSPYFHDLSQFETSNKYNLYTFERLKSSFRNDLCNIKLLNDITFEDMSTLESVSFKVKNDNISEIGAVTFEESDVYHSNHQYTISELNAATTYPVKINYTLKQYPEWGEISGDFNFSTKHPINSFETSEVTQSIATFNVVPYDDYRISKPYITIDEEMYECDSNGDITIRNLTSNTPITAYAKVKFKDIEYSIDKTFKTMPLNPDVIAEVGPTTISVTPTYDKIDGIIKSSSLTINGQEYTVKAQAISGLTPGSSVSVVYSLNNEEVRKSFELPELVLTTLPARATSKDCAIICAETNMSEDEIGGGFEWRRYDAPDMVPSNSVACPVANGHMEGRLNGLSSGTYYKYRPFYEDATGQKTYGEWTAFGTADVDVYFVPTVYTYTARSVGSTSATLVGYALAGSEDVTEQGFEYWPEVTSRAATTEVKRVLATGQRMMATIDDLEPGMTYNVRAFATTKTETTYGELQQFETEAIDDPIEDSIEEVETVEPSGQFDIYTLTGVCVRRNATDFSGLRSGIYIANGRKIMVR